MATQFPDPPTWAEPVIEDEVSGKFTFNPVWLQWFLEVAAIFTRQGSGGGSTGDHNILSGLQGGGTSEYYHLTAAEHGAILTTTGGGSYVRAVDPVLSPAAGVALAFGGALTNGAGALAATLLNAPVAGNPTKWVTINDNGTPRQFPLW